MTFRFNSLTVVLAEDTREDDCMPLIDAILMLKGVVSVAGNVADLTNHIAEMRVRRELSEKLMAVLHPPIKDTP